MLVPWLQTDWMNRVAFDPEGDDEHVESFFFKANDPVHHRALWVRCTLFGRGAERYGQTWALWFDRETGRNLAAANRHPLDRISIDPERGGVGIGECTALETHTHGVVRSDKFVISWCFDLDDELGPYKPLPFKWMYRPSFSGQKILSPHPCAAARGWVEIWDGTGPDTPVQRLQLDGWRAMQGHNWGRRNTPRYAWVHCNAFDEVKREAFFEGNFFETSVSGIGVRGSLGRLVLGDEVYAFDTFRNVVRAKAPASGAISPHHWNIDLEGPGGRLVGEARSRPQDTLALPYHNPSGPLTYCLNSKLADLNLTLHPRSGQTRTLRSSRAALEVVTTDPNHGVPLAIQP